MIVQCPPDANALAQLAGSPTRAYWVAIVAALGAAVIFVVVVMLDWR